MCEKMMEYPYKIVPFAKRENEEMMKYFKGERSGYVRVGPKNYVYPAAFQSVAKKIYNLKFNPDDIFVVTFPRSGTTWTQQLVGLIAQERDTITAMSAHSWIFLELQVFIHKEVMQEIKEQNKNDQSAISALQLMESITIDDIEEDTDTSGRLFKSHLPLSLLPPSLLDTAKVVYVARHPLDAAVSFYHHNRLIKFHDYVGDFKTYWELFRNGNLIYTPYFDHLKEAYEKRDHPNMLFLYYEDMCKDLPSVTKKMSKFLGKELSEERVQKLCQELNFDNFKNNPHVNMTALGKVGAINDNREPFIRKGKVGDWENYFDEEMKADALKWIEENLKGTDIKFPSNILTY